MSDVKFSWECPYCSKGATITDSNYDIKENIIYQDTKDGYIGIQTEVITCPNPNCKEYTINIESLHTNRHTNGGFSINTNRTINSWRLKPNSMAKQFPDYIPEAILNDYNEACLIRNLSPKASATLSRRCLQGMIRDFWKVTGKKNLFQEIDAIKDRLSSPMWEAIKAVKDIGNIGAHMEQNVNIIIDVEPDEAQALIRLIEILLEDWYITRHERERHLEELKNLAINKKEQKQLKKEPA